MIWTIILTAWLTLNAMATVAMIGKPRKPTTSGDAVVAVAVNIVIIVLLWTLFR
jgi:hypothetical protein